MYKHGKFIVGLILLTIACAGYPAMARRTLDVIPFMDVKRDAVSGTWKLDHGELVSDDSSPARIRIPYQPPEEYDLRVEFIRVSRNDSVALMFSNLGHSCSWQLGASGNAISGFSNINGLEAVDKDNPTRFEHSPILKNDHKHFSIIQVRKGSVTASLDGKVICKCSLDPSKFGISNAWSLGADGLGVGSWGSSTVFRFIEVSEISGPGKFTSGGKTAQQQDTDQVNAKQDQPKQTEQIRSDVSYDDKPISGPTTRVSRPISTIKTMQAYTTDAGILQGQTSEIVLTIMRGDAPRLMTVRYDVPVGDQMTQARDDVQRFIRVTCPNWYADAAEITFEDKYVRHEGDSNGSAVGTLILSAIQGFKIDPNAAITGDTSADGKVPAIGGISAKIRAATAAKCAIVAIPVDNCDQLVDAMVHDGSSLVSDVQVIGISDLDSAVAAMRADRDPQLAKALSLFSEIQQNIGKSSDYLHSQDAQDKLVEVLDLAPQHLSAKLLFLIAQGKQPQTLSANASLYYTFAAVRAMEPILKDRSEFNKIQVPSSVIKESLADLKKLRPMSDPGVQPLIDAFYKFTWRWSQFQAGNASAEILKSQAEAVDDAMAKLHVDQDQIQKVLKEGI